MPHTLEHITPVLFEASRLLSVVPAVFGVLYNLYLAFHAPQNGKIAPIDYAVSALWVRIYLLICCPHNSMCLGCTHRIPVPQPYDRSIPAMEGVLSSIIHPHSAPGPSGDLLARNTCHPGSDRLRATAGGLLGRDRQFHVVLSSGPTMGDEQPLVGVEWQRRELAAQTRRPLGWETVGLE